MGQIPVGFCFLLHHIVPSEYLLFLVVVEQIERSARQAQHLSIRFYECIYHVQTQVGGCSLVGLIDDKHIPISLKYLDILVKLTTHHSSTSKVLHRRKIHITVTSVCKAFERGKIFAFCARTVMIVGLVEEYLLEILKPSLVHHRTVSEDERALCLHLKHHFKGAQGFAKPHLGIPQHLVASLESL